MSIVNKLTKFAKTPQGKKAMQKAQHALKDPKTQAKLKNLTGRNKGPGAR